MRFHILNRYPDGDAETYVWTEGDDEPGDAEQCSVCGRTMGMLTWLRPYRVNLKLYGKEFGDLAFFAAANDFLVSQRFREMYHSLGLTGLKGFDLVEVLGVESRRKQKEPPPAYFRVSPTRGQTALDFGASEFEWVDPPTCPTCRNGHIFRWKRLVIDEATWSGDDVFIPRGVNGRTLVSERFKNACEQNGITNAVFTPAEESAYDFYPWLKDPSEYDQYREPKSGDA